jgi:hypothetical protein
MKKNIVLTMLLLFAVAAVFAGQRTIRLVPATEDFVSLGAGYQTMAEDSTWTGIFLYPGYAIGTMPDGREVEVWILGDSTAAGDKDSLRVFLQPLFYDVADDTMRLSTTTALAAANASTDQAQLATIAIDTVVITPAAYAFGATDFVVHRKATVGLCDAIKMTIILGPGAGSIQFKPRIYFIETN